MTQKERLVELLKASCATKARNECTGRCWECTADYLLSHGVIVPPVQVGQTVLSWRIDQQEYPDGVFEIRGADFGKNIFLTREEAEKALKEV